MHDESDRELAPQWEAEELARDRESFERSPVREFWDILRPGIWHATSPAGFEGILATKSIEPNPGDRSFSFPQTGNSYALATGGVALFDFGSSSEEECISCHWKWTDFFYQWKPVTFVLGLERTAICAGLVANAQARREVGFSKVWIPWVEAWHKGPIPLAAIEKVLLVLPSSLKYELFTLAEAAEVLQRLRGSGRID
jgi:hypothetical protein